MLRIYMSFIFLIALIGWILYRLFIKKDLKKNINTLYVGLVFIGVWALIYYFLAE
ncbi:MAG: hypothetical protein AMXMBFR79_18260 [Chitinophagaceae bacterium]